jgi:hypothetical protein
VRRLAGSLFPRRPPQQLSSHLPLETLGPPHSKTDWSPTRMGALPTGTPWIAGAAMARRDTGLARCSVRALLQTQFAFAAPLLLRTAVLSWPGAAFAKSSGAQLSFSNVSPRPPCISRAPPSITFCGHAAAVASTTACTALRCSTARVGSRYRRDDAAQEELTSTAGARV